MEVPTVYIVDDDSGSLNAMRWLVESMRFDVVACSSPHKFLDVFDPQRHGCIVLDVRMPGMSGLDLQEALNELEYCPPVIFITGHGEIPMSVRAIRAGAIDFLEKPVNDQFLLDRINEAVAIDLRARESHAGRSELNSRVEELTPREHEVMELLVSGKTVKEISTEFDVSVQTASKHRARVLEKIGVQNDVELVRRVLYVDPPKSTK